MQPQFNITALAHCLRALFPDVQGVRAIRSLKPVLLLGLSLLALSCGAKVTEGGASSSQTHWLKSCQANAECGELACVCGACTKSCDADSACSALSANANCSDVSAECGGKPATVCTQKCKTDAECGSGACSAGQCVLKGTSPMSSASAAPVRLPAGAHCSVHADCKSGICEGEGCGTAAGVCANEELGCTTDVGTYCGCDGKTFSASGSCPGERYSHRGECDPNLVLKPGGAVCSESKECESGTCEGKGCGTDQGVCANKSRACSDDLREYCGCDAKTFRSSGSCPGARYEHAGACGAKLGLNEWCTTGDECESGTCAGQGCGELQGVCSAPKPCVPTRQQYCDCAGQTVEDSVCPLFRYAYVGACGSHMPKKSAGEHCNASDECETGLCDGQGCGDLQGVCQQAGRACLADDAQVCDCNGKTISVTSSACPGVRFAHNGACTSSDKKPAGATCNAGAECESGTCEGQGCGNLEGVCSPPGRSCPPVAVDYCDCSGTTVTGGHNMCSGVRYEYEGACTGKQLGANCSSNADCASGLCEGVGCSDDQGICADPSRPCTTDVATYCGCDGKTFGGSSSCAGGRYAHAGACTSDGLKKNGDACMVGSDCQSGVCEGLGCGDLNGLCQSLRPCAQGDASFCGCDGKTVVANAVCPSIRYQAKGACLN